MGRGGVLRKEPMRALKKLIEQEIEAKGIVFPEKAPKEGKEFCPNAFQLEKIKGFWWEFGRIKNDGRGFSESAKLKSLIRMADVVIPFKSQQSLSVRRKNFQKVKERRCSIHDGGICFVCGKPATERHHIIQLQNGGINSKKNVIPICRPCHCKIHPWMEQ